MSLYLISYQKSVELVIFPYQTIFGIWTQCAPVKHSKTEQFYKWDRHAFWPPKNPPLYSRKYECNYHFVQATFFCEDSSTRKKKTAAILQRPGQFQKLFIFSGQKILGTVYKLLHPKFKIAMTENSWILPLRLSIYWINWQL